MYIGVEANRAVAAATASINLKKAQYTTAQRSLEAKSSRQEEVPHRGVDFATRPTPRGNALHKYKRNRRSRDRGATREEPNRHRIGPLPETLCANSPFPTAGTFGFRSNSVCNISCDFSWDFARLLLVISPVVLLAILLVTMLHNPPWRRQEVAGSGNLEKKYLCERAKI